MPAKKKEKEKNSLVSCRLIFFVLNIFLVYIDCVTSVISILSFSNSCHFLVDKGMRVDGSESCT